ncbi:purine nucleosidase [Austwickia chelonae]|uniref:Putative inosine/uridine-preferring nucleoside hydrolase n=1 Tax=Austwickia chelonae NBRC 105200 TaxID=1184607 RepID=K6VA31_9MICO|nr:nucleoside hydrolase [Austwickia chelonae]GAB79078.1 putative inosine/uridine-preferring nucleoside hydrolase [Austwickia chelonae NBRC 105200]SEW42101.1 purine nucleosidase [Austwickia chelonae]
MAIPLVIDTDTAQDDCVALLVGLLDPAADLRAITMVAGNVGFDRQVRNAWMTLSVAGRLGEVPVHLGCRRPLMRAWVSAEDVHGDGTGGLTMDDTGCEPESEHGVDALIRLAEEHAGELTVVAIGPLTNIAAAVSKDPGFVDKVKTLVVMGGSNNGRGNITAAAEFNFYVDPEAARIVCEAGFKDLVVVPWAPLTVRDATFGRDRLARLASLDTPLSHFFSRIIDATLAFDEAVGIPGSTHPDSLSAAIVLHPELVTRFAPYHVTVETSSEAMRGYSAMSWLGPQAAAQVAEGSPVSEVRTVHQLVPNATVIEEVDADAFFSYVEALLGRGTSPSRPVA